MTWPARTDGAVTGNAATGPTATPDAPVHGGTDGGAAPAFDFSTNANPLGPGPAVSAALAAADPSRYPDPAYIAVRAGLAAMHGRTADEVVVGAGACELIHRALRVAGGPVVLLEPTFGEYRYAAAAAGLSVRAATDLDAAARLLPGAALAVLVMPSTPVGLVPDEDRLAAFAAAARAAGCRLLLDLAYHPLAQHRPVPPSHAWQLWAPNKAHGVTGVRAGYLLAPRDDAERLRVAPSWVLSAHGAVFLGCLSQPRARAWVRSTRATLWTWRDELAADLRGLGIGLEVGCATYLVAHVGDAGRVTARLRDRGVAVRDATSFGLPGALRLSAQPPAARSALVAALRAVRS